MRPIPAGKQIQPARQDTALQACQLGSRIVPQVTKDAQPIHATLLVAINRKALPSGSNQAPNDKGPPIGGPLRNTFPAWPWINPSA
jgi:hypothetical protein